MAAESSNGGWLPNWWYEEEEDRWQSGNCIYHNTYCMTVEEDMRLIGEGPPLEDDDDDNDSNKIWEEERIKRMEGYINEIKRESEMKKRKIQVVDDISDEEKKRLKDEQEERSRRHKKEVDEMWKNMWLELKKFSSNPIADWKIQDKYDNFLDLLTSPSRNYLIKSNKEKVPVNTLAGKYIVLYFWPLRGQETHCPHDMDYDLNADLLEIYNATRSRGFEVVVVAFGNDQLLFEHSFSRLPYLAIPHQDQASRDFLLNLFVNPLLKVGSRAILLDPNGNVLLKSCGGSFRALGPQGFPFTEDMMDKLSHEDDLFWHKFVRKGRKISLIEILGETIISCEGDEVSTFVLYRKTVGLYFFEGSRKGLERTQVILNFWNSKKQQGVGFDEFEIVFINHTSANLSKALSQFQNEFKCSIPWYSLPYDGRHLCTKFRVGGCDDLHNSDAGYFIILEQDKYQPLSYFAFSILEEYGIDAYPFTLEDAVRSEMNKQQKDLVLDKLLSPSAVLSKQEYTTTVSELFGKYVFLFFGTKACYTAGKFLPRLRDLYEDRKRAHKDFEIIYISLDCNASPSIFLTSIRRMPWWVLPHTPDFAAALVNEIFKVELHLPAIAVFGPDGRIIAKESNLAFKGKKIAKFPFIEADMSKVVNKELLGIHNWDLDVVTQILDFNS